MRKIRIGNHDIEFYDTIDELPIVRFHKWQKFLLIDSGIGADILAFDQHIEKARRFCKTGKADLAEKELMNMRQNVYFIQQELSPAHLAFAALIVSIDGKACTDISDGTLQELAKRFADIPHRELTDNISSVKKKIDRELSLYFPHLFADSEVKEYFDMLRKRVMLILQGIIEGKKVADESAEIEDINDKIILYSKPKEYSGSNGVEIQHDKQFENLCLILAKELNIDAKKKTVMEFYNAFEYLKEKARKAEQAAKEGKFGR